jgi:uncharacterized protein (TIGR03086 family)
MAVEPLQTAVASTRAVLAGTRPDQLDGPTPCASWKVRDVINHIIGAQSFFLAGINGTPPSGDAGDPASGDFLKSYDEATAQTVAAFQRDGVLESMLKTPVGQLPGGAFLGLAATDTFVHGWDLAKATGQGTDLEPALADALLVGARQAIQDSFRGPEGAPFGPEQQAPAGASNADKLAAFLGRTV